MKDSLAELLGLPKPTAEMSMAELEAHLAPYFPYTRPAAPGSFEKESTAGMGSILASGANAELYARIKAEHDAKMQKRLIKPAKIL